VNADLWSRPVSYGAVGATQAPDLMQYPPAGYRPLERRARIGHGDERFARASAAVFSWGVQRGSGFRVETSHTPGYVSELTYTPVTFDASGDPVAPSHVSLEGETVYAADGSAYIAPGDTVMLGIRFWPIWVKAPARVVYVVDEARRRGFAYGTLPGHPEDGEESFVVEQSDDGSVWIEIRAFSRPSTWYWWLVSPVLRLTQWFYTRRYLRALAGPIDETPGA
jgi:uncharacterized protein (UPF0548 family)